jgi:hypothetical protein
MMPTTTPPRLQGMVAVSRNGRVKPLGFICWFSVPDEDLKLSRLRRQWVKGGLSDKPLPPAQKSVNAFKRAVRQQEGITVNETDGTKTETDVRDIRDTSEMVEYQVTRVVRNLKEHRIDYEAAIRVWFVKKDSAGNPVETLDFRPLEGVRPKEAHEIMRAIEEAYADQSEKVPGAKVRTIVRGVLKDVPDDNTFGLEGENLRGKAGGIYFVFAKYEHDLERLANVLWTLWPGAEGRAYLHMVPLADGASEKELIQRHFKMNALEDFKEIAEQVAELRRGDRKRDVRSNVVKHHVDRLAAAKQRAMAYADALSMEQKEIEFWAKGADQQIQGLLRI